MFSQTALTLDSIMYPVLGAPVGTGVASTGGIATQTPTAKMLGYTSERWWSSTTTKPRGLHSPDTAATACTPLYAGITMLYANRRMCSFFGRPASCSTTCIYPSVTAVIFAFVVHLM